MSNVGEIINEKMQKLQKDLIVSGKAIKKKSEEEAAAGPEAGVGKKKPAGDYFPQLTQKLWHDGFKGLSVYQRCLMVSFLVGGQRRGFCWPSLDYLAGELEVSRTTIIENIKILEKKGYIIKDKKNYKFRKSNTYILVH